MDSVPHCWYAKDISVIHLNISFKKVPKIQQIPELNFGIIFPDNCFWGVAEYKNIIVF